MKVSLRFVGSVAKGQEKCYNTARPNKKVVKTMKKKLVCVLLSVCLMLSLTACKEENREVTAATVVPTEITAAVPETTAVPTETTVSGLLEDNVDGKVCVGFVPTAAGSWRYAVIEDQEAAVAAFEKATGAIYSDEWWIKGDRTTGLFVEYNGEIWDFVESGELVYSLGRVKAEDAADLYDLCVEAARAAGWKDAVKPEQLTGIVSATLRQGENSRNLTDAAALDTLEAMLSGGKYELGGTGCPFTAWLDVETEEGESLTVVLATDSCGVWMSEGYYYSYGSDSQPLYDLFGVTLEFGKFVE